MYLFLLQLQREALIACIPHIIRHLAAESPVVHTYAAHCIERLLTVKNAQNTAMQVDNLLFPPDYLLFNLPFSYMCYRISIVSCILFHFFLYFVFLLSKIFFSYGLYCSYRLIVGAISFSL